jgi:trypsin-like peptidase
MVNQLAQASAAACDPRRHRGDSIYRLIEEWRRAIVQSAKPPKSTTNSNVAAAPSVSPPKPPVEKSSGSGFFITQAGHLLTNAHVVSNCAAISVKTSDGGTAAHVVATNENDDLAILKVDGGSCEDGRFKDDARAPDRKPGGAGNCTGRVRVARTWLARALAMSQSRAIFLVFIHGVRRRTMPPGARFRCLKTTPSGFALPSCNSAKRSQLSHCVN